MKKKVLAVLLAVCMIASTCVLFASAANFAKDTYVMKKDTSKGLTADNLVAVTPNVSVSAEGNQTAVMSKADKGKAVSTDNIDKLVTFKNGSTSISFKDKLATYYTASGTIGDTTEITFAENTATNNIKYWQVKEAITESTGDVSAKLSTETDGKMYILPGSASAKVAKWDETLSSLTMKVRFFGQPYENLVASEIAKVTAVVNRKSGSTKVETKSVSNIINDLMIGDTVTLTAELKNPMDDAEYYGFNCWLDGSGSVVSTSPTITHTVDGSDVTYIATFVEKKDRHTIDYISNGNGKLVVVESREVFDGKKEQISVLEGRDFTFTIVPDAGYDIAKVVIDGNTDVASFKTVLSGAVRNALITLIKATGGADRYVRNDDDATVFSGTYKFENITKDHTIEVTFEPRKVLDAPVGNSELETVTAEGLTLATGADAEGEGGEGGNGGTTVPAENGAAGNGGSAVGGVVNPATGSTGAIAVFAVLSVAAGAAFVTAKKKED